MYQEYKAGIEDATRDSDNEDSARDSDREEDRGERFVEDGENPQLFKSKTLNDLKPFFNGATLDERMAEIRKSIYYIRQHWDDYDEFLASLKNLLLENDQHEFTDPLTNEHAQRLLSSRRDWLTADKAAEAELGYEAIRLYTSKEGHAKIYSVSDSIFRKEDSVAIVEVIRSVVFLVELINIDLYNYCLKCPSQSNFEGIVYRGLCLTSADAEAFRTLRHEPIGKRNIAVPLGLFSASSSKSVACRFIKNRLKRQKEDGPLTEALIIKTHVIGLKPEYVDHYTRTFPSTVLSTICAVDIHQLSRHPGEKEVLLRGPFLLILDLYEDTRRIVGKPCHVLETVMLNANRDHISTSFLGDQDTKARDMFGTMVTVTRSEFATNFCRGKGLIEESEEYKQILDQNLTKLETLMK